MSVASSQANSDMVSNILLGHRSPRKSVKGNIGIPVLGFSSMTRSQLSGCVRVSPSPSPSEVNPFMAALPKKPSKLSKERDLLGAVKFSKKVKRGIAVSKLRGANTRIQDIEIKL